jgi:hypothetical protein
VQALHAAGYLHATIIGRVLPASADAAPVVLKA